ncbi:MAG: hypothetical protein IJR13_05685 [Bacteroidales bacterium]|nr:hypothetical protein [Bacteroidales bacterium]
MKRIKFFLLIFLPLCSGCDFMNYLAIQNNSDYDIFVIDPDKLNENYTVYPDTLLPDISSSDISMYRCTPGEKTFVIEHLNSSEYIERLYKSLHTDTLSFFIIKATDIDEYSYYNVRQKYLILQRYDMGIQQAIKYYNKEYFDNSQRRCLFFPPTEEMKDIKMWPPYGTYDEKGNKIRDY